MEPVNLIGTTPTNIVATDKATQSVVPATYSNGKLSVPSADFVDGRVLSIVYQNEKSVLNELSLPEGLVEGSVTIDTGLSDCVVGQGVTVSGNKISLACSRSPKDMVHVQYLAQAADSTAFQMDSIPIRTWAPGGFGSRMRRLLSSVEPVTSSRLAHRRPPAPRWLEYASHGFRSLKVIFVAEIFAFQFSGFFIWKKVILLSLQT